MPHLVIEYTDNIPDQVDFRGLFGELHAALVTMGDIKQADVKSRAIRLDQWYIADGNPNHALVHVKLYLLAGRDVDYKRRALAAMRPIVVAHFPRALAERECQICFETVDIERESYTKVVSGQA
jgi:5-carboxymethyl-2-hydroxymuconate isomerase